MTDKKKSQNRKIGLKRHGHTMFRGEGWPDTNFEGEFDIDNKAHVVVADLASLAPPEKTLRGALLALNLLPVQKIKISDYCRIYNLEGGKFRDVLLFAYSLLIRSPAFRFTYENFPSQFGLPVSENVGKANMRQNYLIAKNTIKNNRLGNCFITVIHSEDGGFISGDGYLDWLTGSLQAGRVSGNALVPLTPSLCMYVSTPIAMRTDRNCASIRATPWIVRRVNEIVQVYSRDRLFFLGRKPVLTEEFRRRDFLQHSPPHVDLLDELDRLVERIAPGRRFSGMLGVDHDRSAARRSSRWFKL